MLSYDVCLFEGSGLLRFELDRIIPLLSSLVVGTGLRLLVISGEIGTSRLLVLVEFSCA